MGIELREVACGYHGKIVVDRFSAGIDAGPVQCLLGPDGIGKTALSKAILCFNPTLSGRMLTGDRDIHDFGHAEFARLVGYIPQSRMPPFSFKVLDVAAVGCTAHLSAFAMLGQGDFRIAAECLECLEITYLAERVYIELPGGERRLILITRVLAQ